MNHGGGGRRGWVQLSFVDRIDCVTELGERALWPFAWVSVEALRLWNGARERRRREYEYPLTDA